MLGTFSGGGLGFGVAFTLYDNFSRTADQIHNSMTQLGLYTTDVANRVEQNMNQMVVGSGMLAAGLATLGTFGVGVKIAGEFEQAQIGLETLLGSKEEAKEMFEGIKEDAAKAALFGVDGLLRTNRALVSTGLDATTAREDTLALANAIAAVGGTEDSLNRMAHNLQQIRSIHKATGLDIKQFGFAGIVIYDMLSKSLGKTVEEIDKMDITYEQIMAVMHEAADVGGIYYGAAERQAESIFGKLEQLSDRAKYFMAAMGASIMPVLRPIINMLIEAFNSMAAFADSDLGAFVFRLIAILGLLLTILGAVVISFALAEFAGFKLALMFGLVTHDAALAALKAGEVAKAFRIMGAAAWTAVTPYLAMIGVAALLVAGLYAAYKAIHSDDEGIRQLGYAIMFILGPLGWLIGGIMSISKGMEDFDKLLSGQGEKLNGIAGWFQQLGGIIRGVQMMYETLGMAGTESFGFTQEMEDALDKMGVKEFVIALITWIARIEAFFRGVKEGFVLMFDTITGAAVAIVNFFAPANAQVKDWDDLLGRNKDSLESWQEMGKHAAIIIGGALLIIAAKFVIMGIAALWALWPIIATLGATFIVAILLATAVHEVEKAFDDTHDATERSNSVLGKWDASISKAGQNVGRQIQSIPRAIEQSMTESMNELRTGFGQMFSYIGDLFVELAYKAQTWGSNFFVFFWVGIKSVWDLITAWMADAINNSPVGSFMEYIGVGKFAGSAGVAAASPAGNTRTEAGMAGMAASKANQFGAMGQQPQAVAQQSQPATVNLIVDSETVFSKLIDFMSVKETRSA